VWFELKRQDYGVGIHVAIRGDRWGGARTVTVAALAEAAGPAVLELAGSAGLALGGLVVLAIGQGLAVPALGLLALRSIPAEYQGATAGTFSAYFEGGAGIGGPVVGAVAGAFDPQAALVMAGVAVGSAVPVVLSGRRKPVLAVGPRSPTWWQLGQH
jgi:hypothetical protein